MMDRGSLESEKAKEEVTKKSEVIVSYEPILNMIQPVITKEGKNEIPLIKSDMKTQVMACDGEGARLASMEKLSQKQRKNAKKKTRWRFRNWVFDIPGDKAQQQLDVKHGKDMEVYVNVVQNHEWCIQEFYTSHMLNTRFGLIFTKKKKGKTKLEYTWVEINPEHCSSSKYYSRVLFTTDIIHRTRAIRTTKLKKEEKQVEARGSGRSDSYKNGSYNQRLLKLQEINLKKQTEEWLIAHDEVSKLQEETIKRLGEANKTMGDFKRVKKKKKKVKNKKKKKRTNLRRSIVPWQTMGDVVAIVVEDDEKNAGEGRNRQVFEDIDNVFRRNHPKNDTAKINLPRTCSQHAPLVKLVVKRVVVPKPKKRAEKPKDVDVMEIISHSDEEHVLVAVHEIEKKSPAAKNKTAVSYTYVLTARSKTVCCFEKKQKEEIFDVDSTDAKDDLASVEYVEDIYSLYKSVESEWRSKDYMRSKPEINEKMRIILVKWLVDVCVRFELNPEPFYLTMNIMDQFLSSKPVPRTELQLIGISGLLMSSKYEEIWPSHVEDLVDIADHTEAKSESMTNETLDDYLGQECPEFLEEILELCDNQKILFDNKNKDKREKAEKFQKLMSLVDSVMFKNYGKPFTDKFFHELQEVKFMPD
ncbi:hypothetical protein HID58_013506 [Brassica napus]|uniref:Cyclin-like domain-containing protein n=1 Tax=Brassica napus TaxID=3708 RepID=A0ABQ8E454_BRANA|nr:hypothetical protein HID58_013506 [Brassica napus]